MIINSKKFCILSVFIFSAILLNYTYVYPQSTANVFQACKNIVMNEPGYPGGPLGGSKGYTNMINESEAEYLVNDFNSLQYALTHLIDNNGDGKTTIYISDNAMIDFTNELNGLAIPGNVIIASGRGRNGSLGAMIFTDHFNDEGGAYNIFTVTGSNVRITGLRFRGSDTEIQKGYENVSPQEYSDNRYVYTHTLYRGIYSISVENLKIDNCELSGFAHAVILLRNSKGVKIHHNYIHHNRRRGLGYGVCLAKESEAHIYANIFDFNQASVDGDGHCEQEYTATYNLALWGGHSTTFDMHGNGVPGNGGDHGDCDCDVAGKKITIRYNTVLVHNSNCVRIRGNPKEVCEITNNNFVNTLNDPCECETVKQGWDGDTELCGATLNTTLIYDKDNDKNYTPPAGCGYCDPRPCQSDSCLNEDFPDHCVSGNCDD